MKDLCPWLLVNKKRRCRSNHLSGQTGLQSTWNTPKPDFLVFSRKVQFQFCQNERKKTENLILTPLYTIELNFKETAHRPKKVLNLNHTEVHMLVLFQVLTLMNCCSRRSRPRTSLYSFTALGCRLQNSEYSFFMSSADCPENYT